MNQVLEVYGEIHLIENLFKFSAIITKEQLNQSLILLMIDLSGISGQQLKLKACVKLVGQAAISFVRHFIETKTD